MKAMLKIEEVFFFILSVFLFSQLGYSWWWFPVLILVPDIGMIGYFISTVTGAKIYNIVHHRAVSILLYIIGSIMSSPIFQLIGIILFAHSTLDRIFNYGLKYPDDFKHTHLSEEWSEGAT